MTRENNQKEQKVNTLWEIESITLKFEAKGERFVGKSAPGMCFYDKTGFLLLFDTALRNEESCKTQK